jgi:hypothetical protein
MEHGLMWLPLLGLFIGLAYAGWNEYQRLEAYKIWAKGFDRAKYDIYAVLGQKGRELVWGIPNRKGTIEVQRLSLEQVQGVVLMADGQAINPEKYPTQAKQVILELVRKDSGPPMKIPFTQIDIAAQWAIALERDLG